MRPEIKRKMCVVFLVSVVCAGCALLAIYYIYPNYLYGCRDCPCHPWSPGEDRFNKDGDGIITDTKTRLQWYPSSSGDFSEESAKSWVAGLMIGGGGWRMPTMSELGRLKVWNPSHCHFDRIFPWIFTSEYFVCGSVWSDETRGSREEKLVHFDKEKGEEFRSPDLYRAFAVRSLPPAQAMTNSPPQAPEIEPNAAANEDKQAEPQTATDGAPHVTSGRFSKDGQGIITDSKTGLQWYLSRTGGYSWYKAKSWVAGLGVGGGGWRMPSITELAGLKTEERDRCYCDPVFWLQGRWRCPAAWSGDVPNSWRACHYNFQNGRTDSRWLRDMTALEGGVSTFAVRSTK